MQDTPAQAAAVVDYARGPATENRRPGHDPNASLDYAPQAPQDVLKRRLRAGVTVLTSVLLGAIAGWIIDPALYRAVGFIQIEQTTLPLNGDGQPLGIDAIQARQAAVIAGLTGAPNLNVAATQLPAAVTLTPAEIAVRLKAQPVPQSRLISVSYDDADPQVAAAVVNAVMSRRNPPGVTVVAVATPPAKPQRGLLYLVGGSAVGLLLGVAIVALQWK